MGKASVCQTLQITTGARNSVVIAPRVHSTVVVICAPSHDDGHDDQFLNAAMCDPADDTVLWIAEKPTYQRAGLWNCMESLRTTAGLVGVESIDGFISTINALPKYSVTRFRWYGHGEAGLAYLRMDVPGQPNITLDADSIAKIDGSIFENDADVEFDSCNSASTPWTDLSGGGGIAQMFADRIQVPVRGWTGRTSYAHVNAYEDGHSNPSTCAVDGSQYRSATAFWDNAKETRSRIGYGGFRAPQKVTVQPRMYSCPPRR